MPHDPALIESITGLLHRDYPPGQYEYVIEQQLDGHRNRMFPDIQVLQKNGAKNRVVCAVEIGYTRPDKLAFYRKAGIPDVRWYDKAGNHVHDNWDIKVHRRVDVAPDHLQFYVIVATPEEVSWTYMCDRCHAECLDELGDDFTELDAEDEACCVEYYTIVTNLIRVQVMVHCGCCTDYWAEDVEDILFCNDSLSTDSVFRLVTKAERCGYAKQFRTLDEAAEYVDAGEIDYDLLFKLPDR